MCCNPVCCSGANCRRDRMMWKSTALFTLFGFWMQTNLAGFAGCQECRKARRSRMVLDNLRKLLNHHAAKKRKLGSLKKCKQRDLFQHMRPHETDYMRPIIHGHVDSFPFHFTYHSSQNYYSTLSFKNRQ